jgi:hypothetical protein
MPHSHISALIFRIFRKIQQKGRIFVSKVQDGNTQRFLLKKKKNKITKKKLN